MFSYYSFDICRICSNSHSLTHNIYTLYCFFNLSLTILLNVLRNQIWLRFILVFYFIDFYSYHSYFLYSFYNFGFLFFWVISRNFIDLKTFLLFQWKGWLLSCVWLFATPWTIAHQAPLSMGFSRQEY